ncbi:MAG: DMT family transporter [Anaerovorax sp.]
MRSLSTSSLNKQEIKVYTAAIAFSLIVGFSFLGIKSCAATASTLEILAHRFNFAFLGACIAILPGKIKMNIRGKKKSTLAWTAGFYVGFMVLQTVGLVFATSIVGGIIFAIIPILAKIIAGLFLKETTTWKQNIFACLSVAAVMAMFICGATDIQVHFIGWIILFLASICMATSNVIMRGVRGEYTPVEIAFSISAVGFFVFNLAFFVYALGAGVTFIDYLSPLKEPVFLIAIIYLGIPSTFVSSLIMSYMLAHMKAMKATMFGNLSTAISIIAGVVILHEPLALYHIVCTILIVIGVIGVSIPTMGTRKGGI